VHQVGHLLARSTKYKKVTAKLFRIFCLERTVFLFTLTVYEEWRTQWLILHIIYTLKTNLKILHHMIMSFPPY